jgi:hypothetical protein
MERVITLVDQYGEEHTIKSSDIKRFTSGKSETTKGETTVEIGHSICVYTTDLEINMLCKDAEEWEKQKTELAFYMSN